MASDNSAAAAAAGYRGPTVCSIVGITYRQLDYWARTDLLRPSITEARGSGTQRRYSYEDLVHLKVIKRLLDAGISLHSARRAIECLRATGEDLGQANLVIDEGRTVLAHSGEEIVDLLRGGQGVLNIVPLEPLMTEVSAAITGLASPAATLAGSSGPTPTPTGPEPTSTGTAVPRRPPATSHRVAGA